MQRDDGIGVFAVALAQAAAEIRAGAGDRQEHQPALLRPRSSAPTHWRRRRGMAASDPSADRSSSAARRSARHRRRRCRAVHRPSGCRRWRSRRSTRPCVTTGGEVVWLRPKCGPSRCGPSPITTVPPLPKPLHGLPLAASSAIRRRSAVFEIDARGAGAFGVRCTRERHAAADVIVGIADVGVQLGIEAPQLLAAAGIERATLR